MSSELLGRLSKAVIEGETVEAVALTKQAIRQGLSPEVIMNEGLIPGIRTAGELFGQGEYYLPELLVSGKAMQTAVAQIEPLLIQGRGEFHIGKFLIGTVKGDVHDIGKNIVIMMLKGNGWEVTDLGVDVTADKVVGALKDGAYDVFGLSTLLTSTMPAARETIDAIKEAGLRDKIKIMIGGAPVTQEFADMIGADAYGRDAVEAVRKAQGLLGQNKVKGGVR